MQNIWKRRGKNFEDDEAFSLYIAKKRTTTGGVHTWSDGATASGLAATCGRGPIMQLTYPRYKNGVA